MDIINLIRTILEKYKALPYQLEILINNEVFSFFEGINIIDCNELSKEKYIVKYKDNSNVDIKKVSLLFSLYDNLEKKIKNEPIKYKYYLEDTTKTKYYIPINLPSISFKETYEKIITQNLPDNCQYIASFIQGIQHFQYVNKYFIDSFSYNQELIRFDRLRKLENVDNYIIIKCCHDVIQITKSKITFSDKESYSNIIYLLLPFLNCSIDNTFIRFIPSDITLIYPISIDFQLFDLMLYENNLYPYLYTNEKSGLIKKQESLVYSLNLFNTSIDIFLYNKHKQYNETIHIKNLEWYMYLSVKILLNYIYLLYINFHINYFQNKTLFFKIPIKINYNRLFGKFYTRYYRNVDKVYPVIADKEYCIKHNIPYVQWNNNYYKSPEGSGYTITINQNRRSGDNPGIPKCVKTIKKAKSKKKIIFTNISYNIVEQSIGLLPSNLFISYGYELPNLYRIYFDIEEIFSKFKICSKCSTYINIPSQQHFLNILKEKFLNKQLNILKMESSYTNINILSFSVDNEMKIYPYGVNNFVYNFNSSYPFIIVMMNTTRLYLRPNYRYEYIVKPETNLFFVNDVFVQAILSMYKKNNIIIIDENNRDSYISQFISEEDKVILIAEKKISDDSNKKYYLWKSTYSNILPEIPIINEDIFNDTLPPYSTLYKEIKEISGYHYFKNINEKEVVVFGVWKDNIYYPCQATNIKLQDSFPNKPYLLLNRSIDGTIYKSLKNNPSFIYF